MAKSVLHSKDMSIAEIIKELTLLDEFRDTLNCQSELLAGNVWLDKPNTHILTCMSRGEDVYKVIIPIKKLQLLNFYIHFHSNQT